MENEYHIFTSNSEVVINETTTYGQSCGRYVTPTLSIEFGARSRRIHPSFVRLYPSRARFFFFGSRRKLNAEQFSDPLNDKANTRSNLVTPFGVMTIEERVFIAVRFWGALGRSRAGHELSSSRGLSLFFSSL